MHFHQIIIAETALRKIYRQQAAVARGGLSQTLLKMSEFRVSISTPDIGWKNLGS
jgi:hypothetical protein